MGQVSDCPWTESLSGTQLAANYKAEFKITSGANHTSPSVSFDAPQVELNSNFQIQPTHSLTVDNNGCIASCIADTNPCEIECESAYETEVNEKGIRYVLHEVVLTFPQDLNVTFDPQENTIRVNGKSYELPQVLIDFYGTRPHIFGTLERCLCDDNIFFYRNENMIFDEGGLRTSNSAGGGVKEEGGIFSLNYIVDYAETPFQNDEFIYIPNYKIVDRANNDAPQGAPIVAILDSGLNPEFFPNSSLYNDFDPATFVCGLVDPAGWNFVENNSDLLDDRGHGTLVSLAYMKAFLNIDGPEAMITQKLLTVKVLDACGEGTLYATLCGLKYAVLKGADIINCSWGLYQPDRNLQRIIEEISQTTTVQIVCSAGNAGIALDTDSHFPSGYARPYLSYLNDDKNIVLEGLEDVWEVSGSCRYVDRPCSIQRTNLPLAESSNYANINFAEPSKGVEYLLPSVNRPNCQIQGTSFAAPIFAAGLTSILIEKEGTPPTRDFMYAISKKIHPNRLDYSYYMEKCN